MVYIEQLLHDRNLPDVLTLKNGKKVTCQADFEKRKEEIKKLLENNVFGIMPPKPTHLWVEEVEVDARFCASKAILKKIKIHFELDGKEGSFPASVILPQSEGKHPAFVNINFYPEIPNKYLPAEEIVDRGYAVFYLHYNDVVLDKCNSFKNGIAPLLKYGKGKKNTGKIAMWAWAASRLADYALTLEEIDGDNLAVVGHSRLGKTALLAGAFDERFKYIISNNSGCTGAALTRGKIGESLAKITEVFPYWFCKKYAEYSADESLLPLDQHFLLALSVPRHILVGSAKEDLWADPASEFLSLAAVKEVYALYGKRGLIHKDEVPEVKPDGTKTVLADGDACYHIRGGTHYLSREDWNVYMDYIDKNREF